MHPFLLPDVVCVSIAWFSFSCFHNGSQQIYNLTSLLSLGHASTGSLLSYGVHSDVSQPPLAHSIPTYVHTYVCSCTRLHPPSFYSSLLSLPPVPSSCPSYPVSPSLPSSHPLPLLKEEKQRLKAEKLQQEVKKKVILIPIYTVSVQLKWVTHDGGSESSFYISMCVCMY